VDKTVIISMKILVCSIILFLSSCTSKQKSSPNYKLDVSCKLLESKLNRNTNLHEKLFEFKFQNISEDTVYINAIESSVKPHRWIYQFSHDANIVTDSLEFENHFDLISFRLFPQLEYKFVYTVNSPFYSESDEFLFKYKIKHGLELVKTRCD